MANWFRPERTAALAVDLQDENLREGAWPAESYPDVLGNAQKVLAACRRAGYPIIYTRHWLESRGSLESRGTAATVRISG